MTARPDILILRPEPGASRTAERAATLGLTAAVAPLFEIQAVEWDPPSPMPQAILVTSANALRFAGSALSACLGRPCFAVGETTGAAAREAGFADVRIGPSDVAHLIPIIEAAGIERVLHLSGRDHMPLAGTNLRIDRQIVYAAGPVPRLSAEALGAAREGSLALLHSPRAAARFAELVDAEGLARDAVQLAAISPAAAEAAGWGWRSCVAAPLPRDEALLELAAKLCKTDPTSEEARE